MNKIIDLNTGKVYPSAKAVADEFKIPHSTIRCWVNGSRKNYSTFRLLKNIDKLALLLLVYTLFK